MASQERSFAKWMYTKHNAVVVKPLSETASHIHLLDVLVKEKAERRHPVLEIVGSMLTLGSSEAPPYEETAQKLRDDLKKFEEGEDCEFFSSESRGASLKQKFSSLSSLTGSLLSGVVDAHLNIFTKDKEIVVTVVSYETRKVLKEHLEDIIRNDRWKPDTENNRLKKGPQRSLWFAGTQRRGRKMWVVHELLYASKVVVSSIGSSSHGAQLTSSAIAAPVMMGLTPGADVKVRRMGNESLEIAAEEGKKVLFGFRAISFRFDARGEVCDFKRNAGDKYPMTRDEDLDDSVRSHLRGLFLQKPPKIEDEEDEDDEDDEEWDVQALDIEIA